LIFHPTARERFTFLLHPRDLRGPVAASVFFVVRRPEGGYGQTLAITSGLLLVALYLNWMAWERDGPDPGPRRGLDRGKEQGVAGLGQHRGIRLEGERKYLRVGLVEKSSGQLRILPFISPSLYAALRPRVGRLPAEIEQKMGFKV
jgi:hypothetical protein